MILLGRSLTKRRRKITKRLQTVCTPAIISKLSAECLDIEKKMTEVFQDSLAYREEKAVKSIKVNSKYFFSYVKMKAKVKTKVGPLFNQDERNGRNTITTIC